jgi:molybdenum cofactor cytidylyltransferase
MGGENKLLHPVGGVPLVARSVATVLGYPFVEVVVVTGHESTKVEEALAPFPVRFAFNPRYEQGQMTSVRAGLDALSKAARGVMVCLSDQPLLTAEDVTAIAEAFLERAGCVVLVPTFEGVRGNPIVLARESTKEILARGANFGCKQFVSRNRDLVTTFAASNNHILFDLDRPEDLAALPAGATAS